MTKAKPKESSGPTKRKPIQKETKAPPKAEVKVTSAGKCLQKVLVAFKDSSGTKGNTIQLDLNIGPQELLEALKLSLPEGDDQTQYQFFYKTKEIKTSLDIFLQSIGEKISQDTLQLTYHPIANFRVRPVTRSSDSLFGHTEAVLAVSFSPDSTYLASASGDSTVRIWDLNTNTPLKTLQRHHNWVMTIAFSPDMEYLASGDHDGVVVNWDRDGISTAKVQTHKGPVMSLAWEPLHISKQPLLASAGKDGLIRLICMPIGSIVVTCSGHLRPITKILWTGQGSLISCSQDQNIKQWNKKGQCQLQYQKHAHWVNSISISTQLSLTGGCFDNRPSDFADRQSKFVRAKEIYQKTLGKNKERLVSCSDDHTLKLYNVGERQAITRMTGHQQAINHVKFSPNGRFIVSCSFDKSMKLWDGYTGEFMANFRGHVGAIYMVAWSADSRYVVSASKDSTMKVWDLKTRKMMFDLPGHADEVYAVDWSRDGVRVASGGKDRQVKVWRN